MILSSKYSNLFISLPALQISTSIVISRNLALQYGLER